MLRKLGLGILGGVALAIGAPAALAHEDQITIVISEFEGPEGIALGVSNVLKVMVHRNSRSADPPRQEQQPPPFGGGYYMLSQLPVQPPRHDAAEARARINAAQMTLWGSVASVGTETVIKGYLSLPTPYRDFRRTSHEIWEVSLEGQTFVLDLPRRRIDFPLQSLPSDLVEAYARDLANLPICESREMRSCPSTIGAGVRFLYPAGDLVRVRYPTDRRGWIRFPDILATAHPVIVQYTSGMMALFRADWERADQYFSAAAEDPNAGSTVRSEARMLQAMALAKSGHYLEAENTVEQAFEMNRFDATALRYLIMAKLATAASGMVLADVKKTEIAALLAENERLLVGENGFLAALRSLTPPAIVLSADTPRAHAIEMGAQINQLMAELEERADGYTEGLGRGRTNVEQVDETLSELIQRLLQITHAMEDNSDFDVAIEDYRDTTTELIAEAEASANAAIRGIQPDLLETLERLSENDQERARTVIEARNLIAALEDNREAISILIRVGEVRRAAELFSTSVAEFGDIVERGKMVANGLIEAANP